MFNICHTSCHYQNQHIHDVTGIYTCSQYGDSVFLCDLVHLFCQLRILCLGICHFLCGGDYVDALFQYELYPGECVLCKRVCAKNYDICSAGFDNVLRGSYDNIFSVALFRFDEIVHGFSHFAFSACYSYDVDTFLCQKHVSDSTAHCAKTPNDYFDVFHVLLLYF